MRKYKARKGAWFSDDKAQVYGERIHQLIKEKGSVNSRDILDEASNQDSPLHDAFEWNDDKAATKYRLHQAALLTNHIEVEVITKEEKPQEVRAFINLKGGEKGRQYMATVEVINDHDLHQQFLKQALEDANRWMDKYYQLKELTDIFELIKQTEVRILQEVI